MGVAYCVAEMETSDALPGLFIQRPTHWYTWSMKGGESMLSVKVAGP